MWNFLHATLIRGTIGILSKFYFIFSFLQPSKYLVLPVIYLRIGATEIYANRIPFLMKSSVGENALDARLNSHHT